MYEILRSKDNKTEKLDKWDYIRLHSSYIARATVNKETTLRIREVFKNYASANVSIQKSQGTEAAK